MTKSSNPRQLALMALRDIYRQQAYTDIALDRVLRQANLSSTGFVTELVYGIVRRRRTLDVLIEQLGTKSASQQPPNLRIILQIGLYQLRYLTDVPASAAVDTTVELAKENRLERLSGVVNGILRQYLRLAPKGEPLALPDDLVQRIGIFFSFPDWIVKLWLEQEGQTTTEKLCDWFNQPPTIDLRINPLKTTIEAVEAAFVQTELKVTRLEGLAQGLRLIGGNRAIPQLPGFPEGWWTVQDASAQLVSHLLAPQAGEVIIDACAAPGGKTTHIAELMQDRGTIWACDRSSSRLKKLQENSQRLQLNSLKIISGDSRDFSQFTQIADRVLLDAPCSGLGTLHRHPDIRWQQTPAKIQQLSQLQKELLQSAATWVKPQGILVYATCTLNCHENEAIIQNFLRQHPNWQIQPPDFDFSSIGLISPGGWLKILPFQHQMDGFFMVKLKKG